MRSPVRSSMKKFEIWKNMRRVAQSIASRLLDTRITIRTMKPVVLEILLHVQKKNCVVSTGNFELVYRIFQFYLLTV